MACVASKIVAAPFSYIGSIGVVAQIPNFNKVLKKHDVDYEQVTAGKYKRTLTMFGENTPEGREKFKQELTLIHDRFKEIVSKYRPSMDIDNIATGGEVAKMADAYGYSVKEYNGIQNNIVKDLEKIQQQQIDDAEVGYYNNAMQYINQIQTDNTLNRIALQKLASPGARGEEDNKKTQAIMAYDFDGAIPPTYESYLLKPVTTGAVMSNQTVLFNTNGYGSVYAGQLTSPQYIRNPIQRTATSLPVKT